MKLPSRPAQFRVKLLFAFWGLAIAVSLIIGFLTIRTSRDALFKQIQSNVLTIAIAAASQVDGDLHERIREPGEETGEAYRQIENTLRRIRDRNRRDDLYVAFVYTMRPDPEVPGAWFYVVDAEEEPGKKSAIGERVTWENQGAPNDQILVLGEAYAERGFVRDSYGHWLSANAPIKTPDGSIVAMLGVDLRADDVIAKRAFILYSSLFGLGMAILIGAVLSFFLSNWATRPLRQIAKAVREIGNAHLHVRLPEGRADEFGQVAKAFNEMANSLQERDALKGALARYVSLEIGTRLIEEGKLPVLRGDRREVTVLCCRSENIGVLIEKFPPETTVEILNHFSGRMVDIVFSNSGTLDRLWGNGLIAVFGAPLDDKNKECHAIRAAIELQAAQKEVNEKWGLTGKAQFRIKLGLHSGDAIVGNIGSNHRVEFTVVGDTVDLATMIEGLNSHHRTTGLVSEAVVEPVREKFHFREVGEIQPPGRSSLIRLYTLSQFAAG